MSAFPKGQLAVLLAARMVEPVGYTILFPFVNNMMEDLLPDVPKSSIGKYSGAIESVFALSSVLFMYQWGRLSDRIGRKPVILGGLSAISVSLTMFGLSKSFWWAMGARIMSGALCGNASAMRAVLAEITNKENEGWVYPLWSICWDLSCVVGPAVGALLQNPAAQYPDSWIGQLAFARQFPYFLPCALVGFSSFMAAIMVFFCLEETHPSFKKRPEGKADVPNERTLLLPEEPIDTIEPVPTGHSFRELISIGAVQQVLLSVFLLTLTAMSFDAGFSLFAYSSYKLGGIGINPASIALCLSIKGGLSIFFSVFIFPIVQRSFGTQLLYRIFASCWVFVYSIPPLMNWVVSNSAAGTWVKDGTLTGLWGIMIPLLLLYVFGDLCFPLNMLALNTASPSPSSLGGLNAISLVVSALARSMGPAMLGYLFGVSAEKQFPIVWIVFGGIAVLAALQAYRVKGRREEKDEDDRAGEHSTSSV
ncbi:hypothetical protein IAT38_006201 [Cryptococcus sp. DSM 104549]